MTESGREDRAQVVLVGGSCLVGQEAGRLLASAGVTVVVADSVQPHPRYGAHATWLECDPLTEDVTLPPGRVVLLAGCADHHPRWAWTLVRDLVVGTARLLPALAGRDVFVVAPIPAPSWEPEGPERAWLDRVRIAALEACPPWRIAPMCRELVDAADGEDSVAALARVAQERLLAAAPQLSSFAVLRAPRPSTSEAELGCHVAHALLTGLAPESSQQSEFGARPIFHPPLSVVVPPRPVRPDVVLGRQQAALWSGRLKAGERWSTELTERLHRELALGPGDTLLATTSGTTALILAIVATAGPARAGDIAVVPSFTYRASVDVLTRLGYNVRYVDVDPRSWTIDATATDELLTELEATGQRVGAVVCVDTFGNPCDYEALRRTCDAHGVALVADSAAGLGSRYRGVPVGAQADAHAFSMSFAKVLTAGGAGGAVVLRGEAAAADLGQWTGSSLMSEVHAIAALDQLAVLDELVERRNRAAVAYRRVADSVDGLVAQEVDGRDVHSYVHWVVRTADRDRLAERLADLGVHTKPYFPAQHLHHPVAEPGGPLPVTAQLDREALALPMSSELSDRQIEKLCLALRHAASPTPADSLRGQR